MRAEPSILVVGSTMIDLIAYADRLPEAGETLVGTAFRSGFGGKGANQAVAAARLGARVALVNTVGDDGYGGETIANLAAQGVDTTYVRRVPGSSGVAPIWVDGAGMNRIIIVPGANLDVPVHLAIEAVTAVRPAVVVGQFEIPQAVTAAAFVAARAAGAVTILNPAPAAAVNPDLVAATDWLAPNEHEFALIGGSRPPWVSRWWSRSGSAASRCSPSAAPSCGFRRRRSRPSTRLGRATPSWERSRSAWRWAGARWTRRGLAARSRPTA
jgi:ribokinase